MISLEVFIMASRKTHEEFVKEVLDKRGNDYAVLGIYINARTKIEISHNCGYKWNASPNDFVNGRSSCPKCAGMVLKDTDYFKEEVYNLVNNEYDVIGKYSRNHLKIDMIHNKCKTEFKVTPNAFLRGSRCPKCGKDSSIKKRTKTHEQFLDEVYEQVGDEYSVLGMYSHGNHDIEIMHNTCGHVMSTTPNYFIHHQVRCIRCNESKGEQRIRMFLEKTGIQYKSQFIFEELKGNHSHLKFDFAIFKRCGELALLVEYDGEFHFKAIIDKEQFEVQKEYDKRKDEYCRLNNIPLVRIPYWEFSNIEGVLKKVIRTEDDIIGKKAVYNTI